MVICSYTDGYVRFWDARNGHLLHAVCGGDGNCVGSHIMLEDDMQVKDMAVTVSTHDNSIWITTAHDNGAVKVFRVHQGDIVVF